MSFKCVKRTRPRHFHLRCFSLTMKTIVRVSSPAVTARDCFFPSNGSRANRKSISISAHVASQFNSEESRLRSTLLEKLRSRSSASRQHHNGDYRRHRSDHHSSDGSRKIASFVHRWHSSSPTLNLRDEQNQVMTTNVQVTLKWQDEHLRWSPVEYNDQNRTVFSAREIWIPDIVSLQLR